MGRVKEFATWLSCCIYQFDMTDKEILSILVSKRNEDGQNDIEDWIQTQIEVVRKNPQLYKNMAE